MMKASTRILYLVIVLLLSGWALYNTAKGRSPFNNSRETEKVARGARALYHK